MSMTDEKLEVLIGKLLDGEITPAEQRWLDEQLERNDEARELLEQLRTLHECSRQAVSAEVLERGKSPKEILELTWPCHRGSPWRRIFKADGHLRFAAGLAAGFLLGLLLHFALVLGDTSVMEPADQHPLVAGDSIGGGSHADVMEETRASDVRPVMRNVDWYSFTDRTGHQWLVEGIHEGSVRPVVYDGDL